MLNFTIGPVMSEDEVLEIASQSTPYFRTPEFSKIMLENERLMLQFVNAPIDSRCVFLTASGTGAMESLVMNVLNDQDNVLVINGGTFGQRFVDLCKLHRRQFTQIVLPFGHSLTYQDLSAYENQKYTALLINMHETSSGLLYDMEMVSDYCARNKLLLLVDAISSFIADEIDMSELGISALITGSQKALAVQPGVSVIALAPAALERVEHNPECCMYLSLKEALRNGERGQTPFTPAVTTLLQINKRLNAIAQRGGIGVEKQVIAARALEFRSGIHDLPLQIVPQVCSNAVTAVRVRNHNAKAVFQVLKDEFQIWICPNGGIYADDVFRVGHIGNITSQQNEQLLHALHILNKRGVL